MERAVAAGAAAAPPRRHLTVPVAGTIITVAALALFAFLAYLFNGLANDTHGTFVIAQRATDPKVQAQQLGAFLTRQNNQFLTGFHGDCDAKAHQLTYLAQVLGGHPDLAVLEGFCASSIPPVPPLPSG